MLYLYSFFGLEELVLLFNSHIYTVAKREAGHQIYMVCTMQLCSLPTRQSVGLSNSHDISHDISQFKKLWLCSLFSVVYSELYVYFITFLATLKTRKLYYRRS